VKEKNTDRMSEERLNTLEAKYHALDVKHARLRELNSESHSKLRDAIGILLRSAPYLTPEHRNEIEKLLDDV